MISVDVSDFDEGAQRDDGRPRARSVVDLVGSLPRQALVRAVCAEPVRVSAELRLDRADPSEEDESSPVLGLHRTPEPLDDRDRPAPANCTESVADAARPERPRERLRFELPPLIADDPRRRAVNIDRLAKQSDGEGRGRLLRRDGDREHLPRESIDHRPDDDRSQQTADAREVDKPEVAGPLGDERASRLRSVRGRLRRSMRALEHSLDGRTGRRDAEPGKNAGDPPRAPCRPLALQAVGEVGHEIGQAVDGLWAVDSVCRSARDFPPPVEERLDGHDERSRRRVDREGVSCLMPEDPHALPRLVVGAASRLESAESRSEEFVFLLEARHVFLENGDFDREGTSARGRSAPTVVRTGDPSGDERKSLEHRWTVAASAPSRSLRSAGPPVSAARARPRTRTAVALDSPLGRGILDRTPMKKIAVHFERETDGRWIAEAEGFPGVLAYGATKDEAFQAAAALCLRVIIDRMEHGEAPSVPIVDELFAVA